MDATSTQRTLRYAYDGLHRLIGALEAPGSVYTYTYDLAGNRTSATVNGITTSQSYNAANQVLGWQYDAAGNLLSDGSTTRSYDALGRMVSQGTTTYASNGDGVLVQAGTTRYTQDLAASLSQILSDGTNQYIYGHDRLASSAGAWYLGDALGSLRQTLDASGAVLATASYDPWGVPTAGMIAPFGFTGELQQGNAVYLRARWYDGGSGIFITPDSWTGDQARSQTFNRYTYVGNSPVNLTDSSGYCYPPIEFLRDIEPVNCSNLNQAATIYLHPRASTTDRLAASTYIVAWTFSHASLLVGTLGAGYAIAPAVAAWAVAYSDITSAVALAAYSASLTELWRQTLCGNPDAAAMMAAPGAFGIPTLYTGIVDFIPEEVAATRQNAVNSGGQKVYQYTTSDTSALADFNNEANLIHSTKSNRITFNWESIVNKPGEVFVYRDGGKITGAMRISFQEFRGQQALIVEELESTGINSGRALLRRAAEETIKRDLVGLIGDPDATALKLYQRYGAEEVGFGRYFLSTEKIQKLLQQ